MRQGPAAVGVAVVVSGGTSTGAIALASLSGVDFVSQVVAGGVMGGVSLLGCSACHSSR